MSKQARMLLGDDGTLDTVIVCSECGEEFRFNFDGDGERAYRAFVAECKNQAAADHVCETALTDAEKL